MTQPVVVPNLPRTDPALQPIWLMVLDFIIGADITVIGIIRQHSYFPFRALHFNYYNLNQQVHVHATVLHLQ